MIFPFHLKHIAYFFLFCFCNTGCKKGSSTSASYTPECPATSPSFSAQVKPLILSACATVGCHESGSSQGAGPLTTYSQVKNSAEQVRVSVANGSMPRGSTLSAAQKNQILCWIDSGANNN
jgi:hypothetical protein